VGENFYHHALFGIICHLTWVCDNRASKHIVLFTYLLTYAFDIGQRTLRVVGRCYVTMLHGCDIGDQSNTSLQKKVAGVV